MIDFRELERLENEALYFGAARDRLATLVLALADQLREAGGFPSRAPIETPTHPRLPLSSSCPFCCASSAIYLDGQPIRHVIFAQEGSSEDPGFVVVYASDPTLPGRILLDLDGRPRVEMLRGDVRIVRLMEVKIEVHDAGTVELEAFRDVVRQETA